VRVIAHEWLRLRGYVLAALTWGICAALLALGFSAVFAVTLP
jgi:fumarate reductase subunit C